MEPKKKRNRIQEGGSTGLHYWVDEGIGDTSETWLK